MPTAKEIREHNEREELIDSLDDDLRERVADGEVEVRGIGEKGALILVDAISKQYVKGTDRPEGSPDMAEVGRKNAFKNTNEYRQAWQSMFGLYGDEGASSFDELMEKLWWAVQGAKQLVDCPHDGCGRRHVYAFKPDPKVMFAMVESHIGRASQQLEITGGIDHVHELLRPSDDEDGEEVRVWSVNPQDPQGEAERRKQALLEAGAIEADWFDDQEPDPEVLEGEFEEV